MKMIFLLLGVAGFSAASAQNKDLFDIQKHLQKNHGGNKKIVEKRNFLKQSFIISPFARPGTRLSHILPNGDKVMLLSQDNMPCIVTDLKQFNMPNLSDPKEYFLSLPLINKRPGSIPNAVDPRKLTSSK
jgi:hypothetical protein